MKILRSILVILLVIGMRVSVSVAEDIYVIQESAGIEKVAMLGDSIKNAEATWGKADRVGKEDMYITDLFYEYHSRGALFTTDKTGVIKNITLYANTGNKDPFHKTGLMWINPSSIYQTFQGATSKGLKFKDKLTPEDVYGIYGKPDNAIKGGSDVSVRLKEGKPLIIDNGKAGFTINYPDLGIAFEVFDGLVESCTLTMRDIKE